MKKIIYGIAIAVSTTSCSILKDYQPQMVQTTPQLRMEIRDSLSTEDSTALLHWQDFYKDATLQSLIHEGLVHNSELETARLRIDEAVASLRAARGLFLPTANLSGEGGMSSFKGAGPDMTYTIGANIGWEINLLGKNRHAVKGAFATVDERRAYRQLVQTRLIATIAQSYYTLSMLDAKRQVVEQTIEDWQRQITTLNALLEAGETDRSSVLQAEASRYEAQTMLEQIDRQRFETEGSLSVLLGRTAGTIGRDMFTTADFSYQLASHVPISALATRPDVRQAEAVLRSTFYQTNVARAAFYPSLRLSGLTGWTNNGGMGVINPGGILLQALASLTQPLFAAGQNRANLTIAELQHQQALVAFSQSLLEAGNEVNNALKAYHAAANQIELQDRQIDKLREAIRIVNAQMAYGDGNALSVITARQSLLAAQLQKLSTEYERIESYITFFRTLGGGK